MELSIAGQMADIITSVITILTLVYLALQIRANTITQQAESRRATASATTAYLDHLVQNKAVARLWRLGHQDLNNIDADEQVQFFSLLGIIITVDIQRFVEHRLHLIHDLDIDRTDVHMLTTRWLATPGGSVFWKYHKKILLDKEFCDFIDQSLKVIEEDKRRKKAAETE